MMERGRGALACKHTKQPMDRHHHRPRGAGRQLALCLAIVPDLQALYPLPPVVADIRVYRLVRLSF